MKEMEYGNRSQGILCHEKFDFGELAIINIRGSHPCAYITFPGDDFGVNGPVHGGFTFLGTKDNEELGDKIWLGWDYAHSGDYTYTRLFEFPNEKKWTTKEIHDDTVAVLEAIKKGDYTLYKEVTEYKEIRLDD